MSQEPSGRQEWSELFRALGQALLDVLRAEGKALSADLKRSGVHLARGLALLGGAAAVSFWTLGVLVLVLIGVLAIWLPVWAAALVVAALFALTGGLLAALGVRQLRRLENPVDDVMRRLSDHLDWWQQRLLGGPPEPAAPPPPAGSAPAAPRFEAPPPRIRPEDPLEEDEL